MPSMVTSIEMVTSEVPINHPEKKDGPFDQSEVVKSSSIDTKKYKSTLQGTLSKLSKIEL